MYKSMKKLFLFLIFIVALILLITVCAKPQKKQPKDDQTISLKQQLAAKIEKNIEDIQLEISSQNDNFLRGAYTLGKEPLSYILLAVGSQNNWQIVFDGQTLLLCQEIEQYNFPQEMIKDCYKNEQSAKLETQGNFTGSGIAFRQFSEVKFSFGAAAEISDPTKGQVYAAWLSKDTANEFIYISNLSKEKNYYKTTYTTDQDLTGYNKIIISLENENFDHKKIGNIILQGAF